MNICLTPSFVNLVSFHASQEAVLTWVDSSTHIHTKLFFKHVFCHHCPFLDPGQQKEKKLPICHSNDRIQLFARNVWRQAGLRMASFKIAAFGIIEIETSFRLFFFSKCSFKMHLLGQIQAMLPSDVLIFGVHPQLRTSIRASSRREITPGQSPRSANKRMRCDTFFWEVSKSKTDSLKFDVRHILGVDLGELSVPVHKPAMLFTLHLFRNHALTKTLARMAGSPNPIHLPRRNMFCQSGQSIYHWFFIFLLHESVGNGCLAHFVRLI